MTGTPDFLIVPPEGAAPLHGAAHGDQPSEPLVKGQVQDDPLGDLLATVRLTGALFFAVRSTSPWCIEVPHTRHFASTVLPRAQHLFSYHIIAEGNGYASVPGVEPMAYETGDILVFPQGDGYRMQDAPDTSPELNADQTLQFMRMLADGSLPFVVEEGGGGPPEAMTICGFLGCDARPFNPLLASLPRMLRLRRPRGEGGDMLDKLIGLTLDEARAGRPGGKGVGLRLGELMFIELLRRYMSAPGPKLPGWLSAMGDPAIARALGAIHARPEAEWTVDRLAREVGLSRSSLAERFVEKVGQPPLRYLTLWRMQAAARLLEEGNLPIAEIGRRVGYEAEPAFSRRFKSIAGVTPSKWRSGVRGDVSERLG